MLVWHFLYRMSFLQRQRKLWTSLQPVLMHCKANCPERKSKWNCLIVTGTGLFGSITTGRFIETETVSNKSCKRLRKAEPWKFFVVSFASLIGNNCYSHKFASPCGMTKLCLHGQLLDINLLLKIGSSPKLTLSCLLCQGLSWRNLQITEQSENNEDLKYLFWYFHVSCSWVQPSCQNHLMNG